MKFTEMFSSPEQLSSDSYLKLGMQYNLLILTIVCSNSGPGSNIDPPQGVLRLNHRNTEENI